MAYTDNERSEKVSAYCNNRLDARERADFENLLRDDPELREECEDFQKFQQLYRRIDPGEPGPSEEIFSQVAGKVGLEKRRTHSESPAVGGRLARAVVSLWQSVRESVAVPWLLAAVQAAVIALLLVPHPRQQTFTTLSGAAGSEEAGINVVFRPDARESQVRELLQGIQGSISSGPSREGRYVISIGNPGDLDRAVRALKESQIVLFAEPAN